MFPVKLLCKAIKVLNSETSAASIGAACALGVWLGCVPWLSLQTALAVMLVLFLRVNISTTLAAALLFKVLPLEGFFHPVGVGLLEREGLYATWSWLTNDGFFGLLRFDQSVVLGGTVCAAFAFVPVWMLGALFAKAYRARLEGWLTRSPALHSLRSMKLFTLYRSITAPLG